MSASPYRPLEKKLGYRFRKRSRLVSALTHRSYRYEQEGVELDNQRLEYLGDAAIGLVVAAHVYEANPDVQEGELTRMRSRVTSSEPLARMAISCRLGDYLLLGKGEEQNGGRERTSNLTDAMEAVIGAAYLDGGIKAVKKIFRKVVLPLLEEEEEDRVDNPKGNLQELAQRQWKITPKYRVVAEKGPSHDRSYMVEVLVGGTVFGTGSGSNKRSAQSEAAHAALEALREVRTLPETEETGAG